MDSNNRANPNSMAVATATTPVRSTQLKFFFQSLQAKLAANMLQPKKFLSLSTAEGRAENFLLYGNDSLVLEHAARAFVASRVCLNRSAKPCLALECRQCRSAMTETSFDATQELWVSGHMGWAFTDCAAPSADRALEKAYSYEQSCSHGFIHVLSSVDAVPSAVRERLHRRMRTELWSGVSHIHTTTDEQYRNKYGGYYESIECRIDKASVADALSKTLGLELGHAVEFVTQTEIVSFDRLIPLLLSPQQIQLTVSEGVAEAIVSSVASLLPITFNNLLPSKQLETNSKQTGESE